MQHQKRNRLRMHIPEEIIILILQRLPVKSLLRFRCVQKSWYRLIQSPSFVTAHSNYQKKHLLFGSKRSICTDPPSLSLRFDEARCKEYYRIHQQCEEYYKMHPEDAKWYSQIHWYAPASHGLICYTNEDLEYERDIMLWNPAIRKLKILPSPPRKPGGILWIALAFGFCEKDDDFKLVKILKSCQDKYVNHTIEVEVYSLNTNSWKTINNDNLIDTNMLSQDNWVFLNSKAYFSGSNKNADDIIVSYDTDKDIMREISLPVRNNYFSRRSIQVLDDSLVYFTGKLGENSFDMWVLKQGDDTNKFCWEKKINVNLGEVIRGWDVLAMRSNKEIILRKKSGNRFVSYDVDKDEEKDFVDSCDQWFELPNRPRVDSFSESLVLFNT